MDCCTPKGYRWLFSERSANAQARRYRQRGLDATSSRLVRLLREHRLEGFSLLEVGGGIGAIQIELLKAGMSSAVSIELTPTYEVAAAALLREAGLHDRVDRRVLDFAHGGGEVPPADIVVLNRVICCYPDMPTLAGAAADHARRVLVMSFPKERWWTRLGVGIGNLALRIGRREFQMFLHPPERVLEVARERGMVATANDAGRFWQVVILERVPD
jgi:magnesium-protoporphyrin O-methyltransferase